jgi:hypothetical protein
MHRPQDKQEKAILTVLEQAEPLCGDIAAWESGLFFVESLSCKIRMMNRRVCCWRGHAGVKKSAGKSFELLLTEVCESTASLRTMKTAESIATCRLCKKTAILSESHLMPKALYRLVRKSLPGDPNPVIMTPRGSFPSDRQIADPLLCPECEDLFSKNGEKWVLANCYRGESSFAIRTALENSQPIWSREKCLFYSAKTIPSIDISKLVYFAASVFWRASVHLWKGYGKRATIDLGREYEEKLRLYLLGQTELPAQVAIWVGVSISEAPFVGVLFPFGGRQDGNYMYRFVIPGLIFNIFLGKRLPSNILSMCILRSADNLIYAAEKIDEIIEQDFLSLYSRAVSSRP